MSSTDNKKLLKGVLGICGGFILLIVSMVTSSYLNFQEAGNKPVLNSFMWLLSVTGLFLIIVGIFILAKKDKKPKTRQ